MKPDIHVGRDSKAKIDDIARCTNVVSVVMCIHAVWFVPLGSKSLGSPQDVACV